MNNDLLLWDSTDGVTTLTMNNPAKLNGWTMETMVALRQALQRAAADDATKVVLITGADPYYCAGVNLSAIITPQHPAKLHALIVEQNQSLFDMFLNFDKPIMIVVNGPAIGASVTSATLCDAIIASEKATFSTPFAKLGVPPEGCSSELFPALLGEETAQRILGEEGWQPTGAEAAEIGLADQVVEHEVLLETAQELARTWIADGRTRQFKGGFTREQLHAVNARESRALGDAFLAPPFLRGQYEFLKRKGKTGPSLVFKSLLLTRPLWARLLPAS